MPLRWYLMDIAQWYMKDLNIMWQPATKEKNTIYLTIDDAIYGESSFEEILTLLDKYGVHATFFVIGNYVNDKNRHLLIRAIEDGHQLANHGTLNLLYLVTCFLKKHVTRYNKFNVTTRATLCLFITNYNNL